MQATNQKDTIKMIELLQFIFILQAQQAGMRQDDVRKILGMNNNDVSAIWQLIKSGKKYGQD